MRIGVFDSGIGGEAVAKELEKAFPDAYILTVNDRKHVPYGSRANEEIMRLTNTAIRPLLEAKCDIIIIACNTATTVALPWLRQVHPQQLFIGLEPMVKPAAKHSLSHIVTICATPATLASQRYLDLKINVTPQTTFLEPDCHGWASMIENSHVNENHIRQTLEPLLEKGSDTIVLACTHYHWIRDLIESIAAGRAQVLEPTAAIVKRIHQLTAKPSTADTN